MSASSCEENLHKGLTALKRGYVQEAVSCLERAATGPPDARVWGGLAIAYWRANARAQSLSAFARAVELDPSDAHLRYNYALALSEAEDRPAALRELEQTLRLRPTHTPALELMSRLQAEPRVGATRAAPGSPPLPESAPSRGEGWEEPPAPWEPPRQETPLPFILPALSPARETPVPEPSPAPTYASLPDFDRFPWMTALIIAVNLAVFWLMERAGGSTNREVMIEYGAQFSPLVMKGQAWRLVTAMFIHAGTSHILFNMLFFAFSGRWVEAFYGRARFLLLYLGAGFAGNLMTLLLSNIPTAGASGAVLGVIAARIVMGFKHGVVIPDHLQRKFGWWPLVFGAWILYSGFHNPQTNNIAHVVGFCTGLLLAAAFAPLHELGVRGASPSVRAASWAMAALCAYTVLGMGWSVYQGLDESGDIRYAKEKFAKGRLAIRLVRFRDPRLKYELRVPKGWERQDQVEADGSVRHWISPMLEAKVSLVSWKVPKGKGGLEAFSLEQSLVNADPRSDSMRTLSKEKRLLSGRVGGRIVKEGTDDKGNPRRVFYYFVPVGDTLHLLVGSVGKYHVPKYEPIFDTIAASFKA